MKIEFLPALVIAGALTTIASDVFNFNLVPKNIRPVLEDFSKLIPPHQTDIEDPNFPQKTFHLKF